MADFNKGEYGDVIYANLGEDISTATELTMVLEPKIGNILEKAISDGVSVGTANIDVNDKTFLANEYIQYTIKEDDLDYAGLWRNKGKAKLSSTNLVVSDYTHFTVLE